MKKIKKTIAMLLSLAMMCAAVPTAAFAVLNNNTQTAETKDDETKSEASSESDAKVGCWHGYITLLKPTRSIVFCWCKKGHMRIPTRQLSTLLA